MNAHDAICKAAHDALCTVRIPHDRHVWASPVPFFDYVADEIEAAVAAAGYTITPTDDGAADTPPADLAGVGAPSAAESATPVGAGAAAPSSPHLTDEARAVRNRAVDVIQDNLDGPAHDGGPSRINVAKVVRALTDAGLLAARRKGATPAIDREALTELIAGRIHGSDHGQAATKCPGSEFCQLWLDAEQAASRLLPLIDGAS